MNKKCLLYDFCVKLYVFVRKPYLTDTIGEMNKSDTTNSSVCQFAWPDQCQIEPYYILLYTITNLHEYGEFRRIHHHSKQIKVILKHSMQFKQNWPFLKTVYDIFITRNTLKIYYLRQTKTLTWPYLIVAENAIAEL